MDTQQMLQTHPRQPQVELNQLAETITELYNCAQSCTSCADACLGEAQVEMLKRCITLCLNCADICETTGRLASRLTEADQSLLRAQLDACLTACQLCGAECERHASHHEHCRVCAAACRRCADACNRLRQAIAA